VTGEQQDSRDVAVQSVRPIESVFVSYNRDDRTRVGELVDGLNRLEYRVWLDEDLSGGQDWWEAILGQIRACDALLLVISPAELQSQACREEVGYARSLGKPVVPVMVQEVPIERLPPDLARLQLVDYTGRSRNEAFDLMVALRRLSTPAELPDPLPVPPPIPMSHGNVPVGPVTSGRKPHEGTGHDQGANWRKALALAVSGGIAVLAWLVWFGPLRPPTPQRPAPSATPYSATNAPATPIPTLQAIGVPNVYMVSEAQARAAVTEAGYNVQIYRVCSSSVAAGYVRQAIEVNPDGSATILVDADGVRPAGQQLAKGSTVTLKISTGVSCT